MCDFLKFPDAIFTLIGFYVSIKWIWGIWKEYNKTKIIAGSSMEIKGKEIIFSSGRTFYAYAGVIGLSPSLEVMEGYDDCFGLGADLTKEETQELADYMICQWQKFKDKQR